jgi:PRTRC genetic system protein E
MSTMLDPANTETNAEDIDDETLEDEDDNDSDDESETEESSSEPTATAAGETAPPAPETPRPALPSLDPVTIEPIFASLRGLLPTTKQTVLLGVAMVDDATMRVSIQPSPAEGEDATTIVPLILTGPVDEIDAIFAEAMSHYRPARNYAVATAQQIAHDQKVASDAAARKAADDRAKRTTTSTGSVNAQNRLTVTVTPPDALVRVADEKGKTHVLKSGVSTPVAAGKATMTVSKTGFKTQIDTLTIRGNTTRTIALVADNQTTLFGT